MRSISAKKSAHPKAVSGKEIAGVPHAIGSKNLEAGPVSWRDLNRVVFVAAAFAFFWLRGGELNPIYKIVGMICTWPAAFPSFKKPTGIFRIAAQIGRCSLPRQFWPPCWLATYSWLWESLYSASLPA